MDINMPLEVDQNIMIHIALILVFTKIFGLLSKKINLPQVVGALLAGIVLGPSVLGIINFNESIKLLSEIGVIVLLFNAGLETDMTALKKVLKSSITIGFIEVSVCLIAGILLSKVYGFKILQSIFMGVILTATSLGISVEALQELKKIKTKVGTTILGVAVVDDILGIIVLTVVMNIGSNGTFSALIILAVLVKIILFFIFAVTCGFLVTFAFHKLHVLSGNKHRVSILALAFCFAMAFAAEKFDLADITGAYIAGLIFSKLKPVHYIETKTSVLSYLMFSPIFFASIGLKTELHGVTLKIFLFAFVLTIVAVIGKIFGNYFGAKINKYTDGEALSVGMGMISRGEVTLVMADKGMSMALLSPIYFPAVILMVITTTLITPLLLTWAFKREDAKIKQNLQKIN